MSQEITSGFMDSHDVLRAHDEALADLLHFPLEIQDNGYRWLRSELKTMEVEQLQGIAKERGAFYESDHRPVLIQSVLNTQQIPVIMATPEVARAKSELITGKVTRAVGTSAQEPGMRITHYPAVVVLRTGVLSDTDRASSPALRPLGWESGGNLVFQSKLPIPVVLSYQIELVARSMHHINLLDAGVSRIFGLYLAELSVNLGSPWGARYASMTTTGPYSDSTTWEGEPAVRLIRHIYSAELRGWVPQVGQLVRTVRTIQVDFTEPVFGVEKSMEAVQIDLVLLDETANS